MVMRKLRLECLASLMRMLTRNLEAERRMLEILRPDMGLVTIFTRIGEMRKLGLRKISSFSLSSRTRDWQVMRSQRMSNNMT